VVAADQQDVKQELSEHACDLIGVVLRGFPWANATDLWLVCRGRLCEDICFGHDSRGEVPRGALDSKDGLVHCSGVIVGWVAGGRTG